MGIFLWNFKSVTINITIRHKETPPLIGVSSIEPIKKLLWIL